MEQMVWEDGTAVDGPVVGSDDMATQLGSKMYDQDKKLVVVFFSRPVKNNYRSSIEGRAIHESKDFIQILVPGDRLRVVEREVTAFDKQRFASHWLQYQAGRKDTGVNGTPLGAWGAMDAATAADFTAAHIRTVEQLAELDEQMINSLGTMGAREWKQRAQAYLTATGQSKSLLEEMEALKRRVRELESEKAPVVGEVAKGNAPTTAGGTAAPTTTATPAQTAAGKPILDSTGKPVVVQQTPPFAVTNQK